MMNIAFPMSPTGEPSVERRSVIRTALAAVSRDAPLSVIDPRGLILDRTRSGTLTLRARGNDDSYVLVSPFSAGRSVLLDDAPWRVFDLVDDADLPGAALLRDGAAGVRQVAGLPADATVRVLTHRLSRRAVVRVTGGASHRSRYVKLLSPKAYARAAGVFAGLQERGVGELVALPALADESLAAFVFDEVPGAPVHGSLWAGDPIDLGRLAEGVVAYSAGSAGAELPVRDMDTERAAAVRALENAEEYLPELRELREVLATVDLPPVNGSALLHGDLHDKQIFIDSDAVRFIDVEGAATGCALIDLVNLMEHFRLRGRQGCAPGPKAAVGFEREAGLDPRAPEVRALRAVTRARLAGVYGCRPWWWSMAADLGREAEALLEEFC